MGPSSVTYSLTEAAEHLGKSRKTIFRWLKAGKFPNAAMSKGSQGDEWRIPADDIAALEAGTHKTSEDVQRESLIELGKTQAQRDILTVQAQTLTAELEQARSDIEHERTLRQRLEVDSAKTEVERDALTVRVSDLESALDHMKATAAEASETNAREKDEAKQAAIESTERAEAQIIDLRDDRDMMSASMGRLARRRYEKAKAKQ